MDDTWFDGVIDKMVGGEEINKAIQNAGRALRRIFDTNSVIIEKYVIEVDNKGMSRILKVQ